MLLTFSLVGFSLLIQRRKLGLLRFRQLLTDSYETASVTRSVSAMSFPEVTSGGGLLGICVVAADLSEYEIYPDECSGLMYCGVPIICPKAVNSVFSVSSWLMALATPKSMTFTTGVAS